MQEFSAKVIEKRQLSHDVIFLSVTCPEDFTFEAGKYVLFKIDDGSKVLYRAYSILGVPSQKGRLDFVIKLIPGGFASEVFRKTKLGDKFVIKGPLGRLAFARDSPNAEHWFIGNGCGIAPLLSMIKANLHKFPGKKFVLLFSTKKREDLLFYDELKKLEKEKKNFSYFPTVTREKWEGKTGRVQEHLPKDLSGKTFYLCGLKELVMDIKKLLLSRGIKEENIKFEGFF